MNGHRTALVDGLENEPGWAPLWRTAGICAALVAALMPVQMIVYLTSPPPSTAAGFFALLDRSPIVGMIDLDLLLVADYVLLIPIYTALIVVLHRHDLARVALATGFGAVGISVYFSSSIAFEMLTLAGRHAAAASGAERALYVAAGEGLLAGYTGTAFDVSYVLMACAGILLSLAMLRSTTFGRATAYLGLAANLMAIVPASFGTVGLVLSLLSLIPLLPWLVLVSVRFLRLSGGWSSATRGTTRHRHATGAPIHDA